MNNWKIPAWLEREVRDRDRACVYCRRAFGSATGTRPSTATWEHIVNDARLITRDNIARCCAACNASKGTKTLSAWLASEYCKTRGITAETVADVVRRALVLQPHIVGDQTRVEEGEQ
jgi:hypothetical protein